MPLMISTTNYLPEAPPRPTILSRVSSAVLFLLSAIGVYYIGSSLQKRAKDKARRGRMKKTANQNELRQIIDAEDVEAVEGPAAGEGVGVYRFLAEQIEGVPQHAIRIGQAAAQAALNAAMEPANQVASSFSQPAAAPPPMPGAVPVLPLSEVAPHPLMRSASLPINNPLMDPHSHPITAVPLQTPSHPSHTRSRSVSVASTPQILTERDTRVFFDFLNLYAQVDDQEAIAQNLAVQLAQAAATAQTLAAARAYSASVPSSPTRVTRDRDSLGRPMAENERIQAAEMYSRFTKRRKAKDQLAQSLRIDTRDLTAPVRSHSVSHISYSQPVSPVSAQTPVHTAFQPHPASIQPILLTPAQAQASTSFLSHPTGTSTASAASQFARSLPYPPVQPHQTLPQTNPLTASFSASSNSRPPLATLSTQPVHSAVPHHTRSDEPGMVPVPSSTSQSRPPAAAGQSSIVNSLLQHRRDRSLPPSLMKGLARKASASQIEGAENQDPLHIHQL